jgi:hypothetical protein
MKLFLTRSSGTTTCFSFTVSRTQLVTSLDNEAAVKGKFEMLDSLSEIEIASKILLGAHAKLSTTNPLDYCYKALNITLESLDHEGKYVVI